MDKELQEVFINIMELCMIKDFKSVAVPLISGGKLYFTLLYTKVLCEKRNFIEYAEIDQRGQ